MPGAVTYSNRVKYYRGFAHRTLVWISETRFHGPACSRCAWLFRPAGPPTGSSLTEMKENYLRHCNEEFARHDCAAYPRAAKMNVRVNQSIRSRDTEVRSARTKLQSGNSHS
jgi:hypothetical protein